LSATKSGRPTVSRSKKPGSHADFSTAALARAREGHLRGSELSRTLRRNDTGAFGPVLVTADELPAGCKGLRLQTRLNGEVVQSASISDMVFDVATLVAIISEAITLRSGDVIVTGTPSGVGVSRKPPLFMKAGDTVEVEIEKINVLINPIVDET
jgi:acylpyruvate hydrolase